MVELAYIVGSFFVVLIGAVVGFAAHFARAHFTLFPERLTGNDIVDDLLSDNAIAMESAVVGAKWDENGYWDAESNRNLIYYVLTTMAAALFFCVIFWPARAKIVSQFCRLTSQIGWQSPVC